MSHSQIIFWDGIKGLQSFKLGLQFFCYVYFRFFIIVANLLNQGMCA